MDPMARFLEGMLQGYVTGKGMPEGTGRDYTNGVTVFHMLNGNVVIRIAGCTQECWIIHPDNCVTHTIRGKPYIIDLCSDWKMDLANYPFNHVVPSSFDKEYAAFMKSISKEIKRLWVALIMTGIIVGCFAVCIGR